VCCGSGFPICLSGDRTNPLPALRDGDAFFVDRPASLKPSRCTPPETPLFHGIRRTPLHLVTLFFFLRQTFRVHLILSLPKRRACRLSYWAERLSTIDVEFSLWRLGRHDVAQALDERSWWRSP
jgi:hypothetical protein